jgi:hypothetical protein
MGKLKCQICRVNTADIVAANSRKRKKERIVCIECSNKQLQTTLEGGGTKNDSDR